MAEPLDKAIVRIKTAKGDVVGAGFLISVKHILTCAHVVADALKLSIYSQDLPLEDVHLDFPLITSGEILTAKVVIWRPVPMKGTQSNQGQEDIAVLELSSQIPTTAKPVVLIQTNNLRGHQFLTFGFPRGNDGGLEATGILRRKQGDGWIQIEDNKTTGARIEGGFSGAPIWDEKLKGVVGMAVAAEQERKEAKIAFMIPVEVIEKVCPAIPERILHLQKTVPLWRSPWVLASIISLPIFGIIGFWQLSKFWTNSYCFEQAHQEGKKTIALVNKFSSATNNSALATDIEKQISDAFTTQIEEKTWRDNIKICKISKNIDQLDLAKSEGENLKSSVVIWGRRSNNIVEVNITSIGLDIQNRYLTQLSYNTTTLQNSTKETKDWKKLVTVMTAYTLSKQYQQKKELQKAIDILNSSIIYYDLENLDHKNTDTFKIISTAYDFLGQLYSPIGEGFDCQKNQNNCQKAIAAYKEGLEWDKKSFDILTNLAILYEESGELEDAMETNSKNIQFNPEHKQSYSVYLLQSSLLAKKGKYQEAAKESNIACSKSPQGNILIYCLRILGRHQLQAKQIAGAKNTYKKIKDLPEFNLMIQGEIIQDLQAISSQNPELTSDIRQIISNLN